MLALGMSVQLFSGTPQDTQKYSLYVNPTSETFIKPMGELTHKHGGDMTFMPHLSNDMKKINVTAKWVTNLLLEKIGQRPSGTCSVYLPGDEPA